MKVAVSSEPGVEVEPTVEKFAFGGLPSVPSDGGVVALPFGFGDAPGVHVPAATATLLASFVARWTLNVRTLLATGEVKVRRTSSAEVPLSKLPIAAETSVGASAPLLTQMLKVEMPAGFGS